MKIVLVAATRPEIEPLLNHFEIGSSLELNHNGHELQIVITGVGMVATAFELGNKLNSTKYDVAINAGIAGSFGFTLALGDVVQVTEDVFAEQGAEDGDNFLTIDEMGFGSSTQLPIIEDHLSLTHLKKVKAITVNKVHGHELSIAKVMARVNPQIESMEGAAFFYACAKTATPCLQIRSVSNYVERRNREKWNIGLAVKNLNMELISLIQKLLLSNNPEL